MEYLVTPKELIISAQVFSLLHFGFWSIKHWFTGERHEIIKDHHYNQHKGWSPFKCKTDSCAML